MHPVLLSQRGRRPLTLSPLCPGQGPGLVVAGKGSEPPWGMNRAGVTLATGGQQPGAGEWGD